MSGQMLKKEENQLFLSDDAIALLEHIGEILAEEFIEISKEEKGEEE